ncbi:MAG: hypothetical protein RL696_415 [Actinomycetota bacterium]
MISQRSWHDDWANLQVAVLGLGKSGFSVADTLVELGASVVVFAANADEHFRNLLDVIGAELVASDQPAQFTAAERSFDFAVVSPGFAPSHPLVKLLEEQGVELLTDIDLAFRLRDKTSKVAKWIAITGTNGKTTTTELTTHILNEAGYRAVACGNIGNPILDSVRDPEGFDFLVVELSSFQLHYMGLIQPLASAFLNLAPDHIDWHGSFDSYFADKSKVFENTEIAIIYNLEDSKTLEAAENADVIEGCRAIGFTTQIPPVAAIGFVEEFLVDRAFIDDRQKNAQEIATLDEIGQIGVVSKHLKSNVAAATALARAAGVESDQIRSALTSFKVAPHRIQLVAQVSGVDFIDDSKATNAHAAAASLAAFDSVVWIVGGLLKGVDPKPLVQEFGSKLRGAVVIGKDTQILEALFAEVLPMLPVRVISGADVMIQAVEAAASLAQAGDTVLLAPAAASMDQFVDYVDRGLKFQAEVKKLAGS